MLAISLMNFRNLHRRLDSSAVAVVGFAGVVLVMVAILSIRAGFRATLAATGSPDVAIVLRGGSGTEVNSVLGGNSLDIIGQAPGIAQSTSGPVLSPELLVQISLKKRASGMHANVSFRGVTPAAFLVHNRLRMTAGRTFTPGLNEAIVGSDATKFFRGLRLGDELHTGRRRWRVVGILDRKSVV